MGLSPATIEFGVVEDGAALVLIVAVHSVTVVHLQVLTVVLDFVVQELRKSMHRSLGWFCSHAIRHCGPYEPRTKLGSRTG